MQTAACRWEGVLTGRENHGFLRRSANGLTEMTQHGKTPEKRRVGGDGMGPYQTYAEVPFDGTGVAGISTSELEAHHE